MWIWLTLPIHTYGESFNLEIGSDVTLFDLNSEVSSSYYILDNRSLWVGGSVSYRPFRAKVQEQVRENVSFQRRERRYHLGPEIGGAVRISKLHSLVGKIGLVYTTGSFAGTTAKPQRYWTGVYELGIKTYASLVEKPYIYYKYGLRYLNYPDKPKLRMFLKIGVDF